MTTLPRLQDILIKNYPLKREELTPERQLIDLDIDSLGVMELLFAIEDEFGLDIPNDKQELRTLADVVDYIDRLLAQQQAEQPEERQPGQQEMPPGAAQEKGKGAPA